MTVINLPIDETPYNLAEDGLIWKQVIPLDKEIVYGGKKLKFHKQILDSIKASFDGRVLQQTAFQLVDDQNRHDTEADIAQNRNFDPQRYRGDAAAMTVDHRGLRVGFNLTDEGKELIKKNNKLGVSASIKPNYVDSDGKVHDFVLRHVVGTLDPKIKHMSPWETEGISLSATDEENEEVYDLTTPVKTEDKPEGDTVTVSKADYDQWQSQLKEYEDGEALLDAILQEEDDDEVQPTNLSQDEPKRDPKLVALENRVAASEWKAEKAAYVNAGVPGAMLNLCDAVMSTADDFTINLSNGESADPRETIRKLLDEAKGTVDLSDENGHSKTPDERDAENKHRDEFVNGFIGEYTTDIF